MTELNRPAPSVPVPVEGGGTDLPVLDLSRNEGPLPPHECLENLMDVGPELLRDYTFPDRLEAVLADYVGATSDRVLVTTGGDDAIDRVFRACVEPHGEVIIPVPTFEMIPAFARMAGARVVSLEYGWGTLPTEAIFDALTARTGLVVVVSPDNPTGNGCSSRQLTELARRLAPDTLLMVDQAYVEFADEDPTAELLTHDNVVLIRTLSKAWGLAGLRIGYAVGPSEVIARLRDVGGPFPVSGLGIRVALHRLQNGAARMGAFVQANRVRRHRLSELLVEVGGRPLESQANFVFVGFDDARVLHDDLEAQGIRTRFFPSLPLHLRITVPRDEAEFDRLERALRATRSPEALLFDMDGVLADVRGSYREAIKATCLAYGVKVDDREIAAAKARGNANDDWELTRSLLERDGVDAPLDQVTARFEEVYQGAGSSPGLWRHESLIPSKDLLVELSRAHRLGVVTGRPRLDAERFLEDAGIRDLFASVICREDAPLKPSPEPVTRALAAMGVETAWLFGDTPDDVVAARNAGVIPVGVVAPGGGAPEREALEAAGARRIIQATSDWGGLFT